MSSENSHQGLYADPMLYDILYTPGTAAEIDALEKVERVFAGDHPLADDRIWLEPACGTGRYLRIATHRGRRGVGFDRDERQIKYAEGRGPQAIKYHTADMVDFLDDCRLAPGCIDFAFNPVNSLRHLESDRSMLDHFQQMAAALKPGGIYVVGISLTNYDWLEPEEDLWKGKRGLLEVSQLVNYLPPEPGTARARTEKVLSHLTVTRPRGIQHFDDTYDLRCYDQKQWQRLIGRSKLNLLGSFDAFGNDLNQRTLPYQLEVLG